MSEALLKFPHTPHLLWLGNGSPRDDKVLKPAETAQFLSDEVVIEEKIDGANLGFSIGPNGHLRAQSRGNYLVPGHSHSQWNPLWRWLATKRQVLEEGLRSGLVLYGEWCYAQHTVPYDSLPDWFLGFDIYEIGSRRFWSADRRNAWLLEQGLVPIPELKRGQFQLKQITTLLARSTVGRVPMEGIYLRREYDGWLLSRAKIVSDVFKKQIQEHWSRRRVTPNHLASVPT